VFLYKSFYYFREDISSSESSDCEMIVLIEEDLFGKETESEKQLEKVVLVEDLLEKETESENKLDTETLSERTFLTR
jgi:hypothetical protein